MNKSDSIKIQEMYQELKVKCSCGHSQVIPAFRDYWNCNYCGKKLRNNTKLHFLYKMRKELENEEQNEKRRKQHKTRK